jgi:hypothetical protein
VQAIEQLQEVVFDYFVTQAVVGTVHATRDGRWIGGVEVSPPPHVIVEGGAN